MCLLPCRNKSGLGCLWWRGGGLLELYLSGMRLKSELEVVNVRVSMEGGGCGELVG